MTMNDSDRAKCLIRAVDDNRMLLESLKFTLETEDWRVEIFDNGQDFLEHGDFATPGCIILDVQMPELSGLEIQEQLHDLGSMIPIIFLTGHGTMDIAIHAFRKGAFDFLQKPFDADQLVHSIEKAAASSLKAFDEHAKTSPKALYDSLTDRQKAVLKYLHEGIESCFIAERLGISPRTLQRHRQNVLRKVGVKHPSELDAFFKALNGK
jgi:two-component system response regulator TtrR